jgi:hypothetical protein
MELQKLIDGIPPTNYEKEHGIIIINKEVLIDGETIKLIKITKSDNQKGYYLAFRTSNFKDNWLGVYPTKEQQKLLPLIAEILKNADEENKKFWGENGTVKD